MIELSEHGGAFGGGGKGASINLFVQPDEPKKKDGIWIKADDKFNNIAVDNTVIDYHSLSFEELAPLPFETNTKYFGISAKLFIFDDYAYFFNVTDFARYDIKENTWEQLSEPPIKYSVNKRFLSKKGKNKIYFIYSDSIYKYDIDNNEWGLILRDNTLLRNVYAFEIVGDKFYLLTTYNSKDSSKLIIVDAKKEKIVKTLETSVSITTMHVTLVINDLIAFVYNSNIKYVFDTSTDDFYKLSIPLRPNSISLRGGDSLLNFSNENIVISGNRLLIFDIFSSDNHEDYDLVRDKIIPGQKGSTGDKNDNIEGTLYILVIRGDKTLVRVHLDRKQWVGNKNVQIVTRDYDRSEAKVALANTNVGLKGDIGKFLTEVSNVNMFSTEGINGYSNYSVYFGDGKRWKKQLFDFSNPESVLK